MLTDAAARSAIGAVYITPSMPKRYGKISSSGSIYYVRLQYNKNAKGKWYNDVVIICDADTGAKVGDMMTAVVTVDGVYDEQDASGNDVAVPRFNLLFVDKIE